MSFGDVLWFIIISFLFVAYLMVLFTILGDLFRDRETSGWVKAIWVIALIFVPFLTALIYLIARGGSMAERQAKQMEEIKAAQDSYIKQVAGSGSSPADQIAQAKALLDSGSITQAEFDALKAKALS
ncbi:MAG TPA: SHOCT domain-containing protein [Jiangellales bacterium]|nr:SHOCT domain-containing protein [Jiangellales bacterium]